MKLRDSVLCVAVPVFCVWHACMNGSRASDGCAKNSKKYPFVWEIVHCVCVKWPNHKMRFYARLATLCFCSWPYVLSLSGVYYAITFQLSAREGVY